MFNRETFCTMPWSSIMILPSGDFKICCFSGHLAPEGFTHGVAVDDNGVVMNVLTHDIMEAMNSKWHKELRLTQSKGKRHPTCEVCWHRDDAASTEGARSASLRMIRSYYQNTDLDPNRVGGQFMKGSPTHDNAIDMMQPDGSISNMPISLDLRFSNLCNMKCIMCDPTYSNMWYEDHIALKGSDKFSVGPKTYQIQKTPKVSGGFNYSTDMDSWNNDPRWWNQFEKMAPHLRHVYLTGGEPFVQPSHKEFIQKLIERDFAKNIVLEYDTNLSVINPNILESIKQFKDVIFRVSIDDINERYELIRFPGKFDRIEKNLKLLDDYDLTKKAGISTCIGIYSIFAPIRLHNHFKDSGIAVTSVRALRSPHAVDIANIPPSVKKTIIQIYEKSDIPDRCKFLVIGYLKNNMDFVSESESKNNIRNFVNYMDSLDRMRKTDWRATFPEVVSLLKLD